MLLRTAHCPGAARHTLLSALPARLLLLALLCCGQAVLAAEPAADSAPDSPANTGTTADDTSTEATAGAADAAGSDDTVDDSTGDNASSGSLDGEGFVPSVQISEDLSVSFPTDI